jgi:hypothetical protein
MGTAGDTGRREQEIELNGKKYSVREFDLDELGEIENFIRSKHAKLYREASQGIDPAQIEHTVMKIVKTALSTDELAAEMTSGDCVMDMA